MSWRTMPTVNGVSVTYAGGVPTLDELRQEAHAALEQLRTQQAEIEAALLAAQSKPATDTRSRKYLRLWIAVMRTKLFR